MPEVSTGGLHGPEPGRSYVDGAYYAQVLIVAESKAITFWWRHKHGYQMGDHVESFVQNLATSYWPNHARWLSKTEFLVSGISPRTGNTVIEIWTFDDSDPSMTTYTDASGQLAAIWKVPARLAVDRIFDESIPGMGTTWSVLENKHLPGRAFVQFKDSGDIYDFDWKSGQYSRVASPQPGAPLHVPDLAQVTLTFARGIVHAQDGTVYSLSNLASRPLQFSAVFLIDGNSDGTLDRWETLETLHPDTNRYMIGPDILSTF